MQQIAFGDFCFDFGHRLLSRHGQPIDLGTRAVRLLDCLLRQRGNIVPKPELVSAAWGDLAVEESNLSVQIAALRRVLGKDGAGRDWIVTVERLGYRFLPSPPRAVAAGHFGMPMVEIEIRVDAAGPEGLVAEIETEDILAQLSRFSSLRVCRSGETRAPVDYRLVGMMRSDAPGELRVRLVDTVTDQTILAETLDLAQQGGGIDAIRRLVAAVESRVHVAELHRSATQRPHSAAPYDLYLRARTKIRSSQQDDNAQAFSLLLEALVLDANNPLLLSAAAEVLHHRKVVGWPNLTGNDQERQIGFARRAWEGSEYDAVSMSYAGNAMFTCGEPELGLALTERAVEMNPSSPMVLGCAGHSHLWTGELERAREYYERAIALAPNDPATRFAYGCLACVHHLSGAPHLALETAKRGFAVSHGYSGIHWHMMVANMQLNRETDARRGFAAYLVAHPHTTIDSIRAGQPFAHPQRVLPLIDTLRELGLPEG